MKTIFYLVFLTTLVSFQVSAQTYSVQFKVKNQPNNTVILGSIKADRFTAIDSTRANEGSIRFTLKENNHSGIYRIVLGQSSYAKIMNEAPQQIDFIFNKENIDIATNFKAPLDSAIVLNSEENKLWYLVLNYEKNYREEFAILEQEVNHFWAKHDTINAVKKTNDFNRLQMARDLFIGQKSQQNNELFAAKLMVLYREPIQDGYLSPDERKQIFQNEYFKTVDFANEQLINSNGYSDKIFEYLVTYNQTEFTKKEREIAYKKGVDIILTHANKNEKVYQFIKSYLNHGFEMLQMQSLIDYVNTNFN